MAFHVPDVHKTAFKRLVLLDPKLRRSIINSIQHTEPKFKVDSIAKEIIAKIGLPLEEVRSHVLVILSLFRTKKTGKLSSDEFSKLVVEAAKTILAGENPGFTLEWQSLEEDIKTIVELQSSLGTTLKAEELCAEFDKYFIDCRILTDVRPVFLEDRSAPPSAIIINHTLKICFITKDIEESIYIAMQSNGIEELMKELKNAITKENSIKKAIATSGIKILSDEDSA